MQSFISQKRINFSLKTSKRMEITDDPRILININIHTLCVGQLSYCIDYFTAPVCNQLMFYDLNRTLI